MQAVGNSCFESTNSVDIDVKNGEGARTEKSVELAKELLHEAVWGPLGFVSSSNVAFINCCALGVHFREIHRYTDRKIDM